MAMGGGDPVVLWSESEAGACVGPLRPLGGGGGGSGWSRTGVYLIAKSGERKLFAKFAPGAAAVQMFQGEAEGLLALRHAAAASTPRGFVVPEVVYAGPGAGGGLIVMEHLTLALGRNDGAAFGTALALLHTAPPLHPQAAAGSFGFPADNTIGATPQSNGFLGDWVEFYRERRLGRMLQLAGDARLNFLGERLLPRLGVFFDDIPCMTPSTLHGDLWDGNTGFLSDGRPVLFDPAVYYGHSEADFGMSWCSAAFTREAMEAYFQIVPKSPGFARRKPLYELYHILNHYLLFGGGYYDQAYSILEALVKDLGPPSPLYT